jgi:hypothetical protein
MSRQPPAVVEPSVCRSELTLRGKPAQVGESELLWDPAAGEVFDVVGQVDRVQVCLVEHQVDQRGGDPRGDPTALVVGRHPESDLEAVGLAPSVQAGAADNLVPMPDPHHRFISASGPPVGPGGHELAAGLERQRLSGDPRHPRPQVVDVRGHRIV